MVRKQMFLSVPEIFFFLRNRLLGVQETHGSEANVFEVFQKHFSSFEIECFLRGSTEKHLCAETNAFSCCKLFF